MGAIAEAIVAYAQPLIDESDGSELQLQHALSMAQLFWNLALLPTDEQDKQIEKMQSEFKMNDAEFDAFRRDVVAPMILRHHQMFPQLQPHFRRALSQRKPSWESQPKVEAIEKYPGTERYAPCPCQSGRKYKFCCGARGR